MENRMCKPKYLYKYQSLNDQSLENLKGRQIWFSKPTAFNDPYDCAIFYELEEASTQSLEKEFKQLREKYIRPYEKDKLQEYDAMFLKNGKPNERFKEMCSANIVNVFKEKQSRFRKHRGVCCFAEIKNDILMWAHYADGHRGFCLEYDTSSKIFQDAFKVEYSKQIPVINQASFLDPESGVNVMLPMLKTKYECWQYEKEWRIFYESGDTALRYDVDALTGIYFGSEMSGEDKDILAHLLQGSPTKLYQVHRNTKEFSLDIEEVE